MTSSGFAVGWSASSELGCNHEIVFPRWSRVLLKKLVVTQLVKFLAVYVRWRVNNSLQLDPVLSHVNPVLTVLTIFLILSSLILQLRDVTNIMTIGLRRARSWTAALILIWVSWSAKQSLQPLATVEPRYKTNMAGLRKQWVPPSPSATQLSRKLSDKEHKLRTTLLMLRFKSLVSFLPLSASETRRPIERWDSQWLWGIRNCLKAIASPRLPFGIPRPHTRTFSSGIRRNWDTGSYAKVYLLATSFCPSLLILSLQLWPEVYTHY